MRLLLVMDSPTLLPIEPKEKIQIGQTCNLLLVFKGPSVMLSAVLLHWVDPIATELYDITQVPPACWTTTIDSQYFTHPHDLERVIEGIEFCLKIFEGTQTFQNIGAKFTVEPIEECRDTVFRS
ncbi:unnamed protein product, partial [Allacma fusca]